MGKTKNILLFELSENVLTVEQGLQFLKDKFIEHYKNIDSKIFQDHMKRLNMNMDGVYNYVMNSECWNDLDSLEYDTHLLRPNGKLYCYKCLL